MRVPGIVRVRLRLDAARDVELLEGLTPTEAAVLLAPDAQEIATRVLSELAMMRVRLAEFGIAVTGEYEIADLKGTIG